MSLLTDAFFNTCIWGKLLLLTPLWLTPLGIWWLYASTSRKRIVIYILLCMVPALLGLLTTLGSISNVKMAMEMTEVKPNLELLNMVRTEIRFFLFIGVGLSLFFLVFAFTAEITSASSKIQKISRPALLAGLAFAFGLAEILLIIVLFSRGGISSLTGGLLFGWAISGFLFGIGMLLVIFYKMWSALDADTSRTTPGKAVGFLFIPGYNLYWMFQVIWGFAKDYNRLIMKKSLNLSRLSETRFLWLTIFLIFFSELPFIGLIGFTAIIILVSDVSNAVNRLKKATGKTAQVTNGGTVESLVDEMTMGGTKGSILAAVSTLIILGIGLLLINSIPAN